MDKHLQRLTRAFGSLAIESGYSTPTTTSPSTPWRRHLASFDVGFLAVCALSTIVDRWLMQHLSKLLGSAFAWSKMC
jgi:ferric-dicitrate binding protein FerR (iron transport regulator)